MRSSARSSALTIKGEEKHDPGHRPPPLPAPPGVNMAPGRTPTTPAVACAVEAAVEAPGWEALDFDPVALAQDAVAATLALTPLPRPVQGRDLEISLVLADDARLRSLNRTYRGKDAPTNVLSFPLVGGGADEAPAVDGEALGLGDLVLALETLARESAAEGKTLRDHYLHLVVHGMLHLLDYDHERTDEEADRMENMEIKILAALGCKNPYA